MAEGEDNSDGLDQLLELAENDHVPPTFCHYTTFEGLQGILKCDALWATYSRTLNDSSEQVYAKKLVSDYLKSHNRVKGRWDKLVDSWLTPELTPRRLFVSCFCDRSDLLTMWQSYAGAGGGYCLEFDPPKLLGLRPHFFMVKVEYPEKDLSSSIKKALDFVCRAYPSEGASVVAAYVIMKIKHKAFCHEKEWRFVVTDPDLDSIRFRSGQSNVKPYIVMKSEEGVKLPLKRIVYGPTLLGDEALKDSLELMLRRFGYDHVPVDRCDIPFRHS